MADLLIKQDILCPLLEVNLASPLLRRCFDGYYSMHYCNNGTAPAENATLEITLDEFLDFTSAELPVASQNGQTYSFQLGNLGVGECGDFKVYFNVSCDASLGQTHCTEAHVYPDSICGNYPGWAGGAIAVEGSCVGDLAYFSITNTGTADVDGLPFTLIKDGQIVQQDFLGLMAPGETLGVNWPAYGDYFSIQVENPSGYPYPGKKMAFVENCGGQNNNSWFAGSLPAGDSEPFIAIDCQQNIGSYDPNDKSAYPVGFGDEHFIERNVGLDYRIRFQNTGTDTAFTVVIRDTLSNWLDPATVRPGAASHPYVMDLSGNDQDGVVLSFRFPDIMLPDSNINEPASHGFIQFSVSQKVDNPLGTIIENNAGIYFDFNEPVITNTVRHEVGENFILINDVKTPVKSMAPSFIIFPNPTTGEAVLKLKDIPTGRFEMVLMDAMGQPLLVERFHGLTKNISMANYPTGLYFIKIATEGGWATTHKFVVAGR
ncbi:MAG: T9SS type A sorting domain-containing protein [Saprospiraceae bacterium]|nr:T9SS type A sorting domain-containing protein [Saprospiraceae bacterium]